ncbi:cyclic nucleotide-binding domain-containing protein [Pseudomonas sp.]|uniref:cyclic nucleotide-binding domain-containing protein n=1 Tax=Pseudomonas sp. TaxID=306 RepID=UPI003C7149C3
MESLLRFSPFDFLSPRYRQQVLDSVQYVQHKAGTPLFKRAEKSVTLYYLLEGKVGVGEDGARKPMLAGSPQACNALNETQPHAQSVVALSDVSLFAVDRGLLERLLNWSQTADYGVVSLDAQVEEQHDDEDWLGKLLSSPLFGRLPPAHLHTLLAHFESVEVAAGETVVRYGEPGEHFFVLKSGRAAVTLPSAYQQEPQQILQVGDFFGEEALVSGAVRSATVTMLEDGVLACLDRALFVELVQPTLIPQVTTDQLKQMLLRDQRQLKLLDVRLSVEYRIGHLPGSISLPVASLRSQTENLDREALYAVTPEGGIRSELAVHLLNQLGFEAYLLKDPPVAPSAA